VGRMPRTRPAGVWHGSNYRDASAGWVLESQDHVESIPAPPQAEQHQGRIRYTKVGMVCMRSRTEQGILDPGRCAAAMRSATPSRSTQWRQHQRECLDRGIPVAQVR